VDKLRTGGDGRHVHIRASILSRSVPGRWREHQCRKGPLAAGTTTQSAMAVAPACDADAQHAERRGGDGPTHRLIGPYQNASSIDTQNGRHATNAPRDAVVQLPSSTPGSQASPARGLPAHPGCWNLYKNSHTCRGPLAVNITKQVKVVGAAAPRVPGATRDYWCT